MDTDTIKRWIEAGTQIGNTFSFDLDGETCWSSVAIQKVNASYNSVYKVYIDEILESSMAAGDYLRDEIIEFDLIEDAINYIDSNSKTSCVNLKPCKGQKIFNPKL